MTPPTLPAPDVVPLPAPPPLLWGLLMATFFVHVVLMNLVLGGAILAAWARLAGRRPERPHHRALAARVGKALPPLIATAVTFGVAPLLFLQGLYGRLFFPAAIVMAWPWLAVIGVLTAAYYGAYALSFRADLRARSSERLSLGVAALLLAIAFVYVNVMTGMLRPGDLLAAQIRDPRGLQLNLLDPTLWPRFLHVVLGALAVGGMAIAHVGLASLAREPDFGRFAIRSGSGWFLLATGANLVAGAWLLMAQPRETLVALVGRDLLAAAVLGAGTLLGFVALGVTVLALQSSRPAALLRASGGLLVVALAAMLVTRDNVRRAALVAAGFEHTPWVAPQWAAAGLFLVTLVAAVSTVGWMAAQLLRGRAADGP
jgi:hypothetical protein